ncbi:nucleotidyl transferase AbiEii/AbiGii toxin family protein [Leadbetterella byssophila]|uniref:nucleotidyl transferase AbiEii/AbiGii toxin family protein n=1 Tax=Leadbetterella byssophila TaxID=316068 RepID=UPI0039A0B190
MIKPGEIQQKAREVGVRDQQIEKDYILSWILKGVSQHDQLSKIIVFKGGTVHKKIYFPDYRFSEDLDFTLLTGEITNEQIFAWFKEAFEYIRDEANIPLDIIDNNEHEDGGINFYISYVGPLGEQGNNKRVKVDISRSEKLEFEPVLNPAFIDYTDLEEYDLQCYPLEEVLIEKLCSVMQRMAARDFYYIWYLLVDHGMEADFYLDEFRKKCARKGLNPKDFHKKLTERLPQYKGRWKSSMSEQIKDLPEFDKVEREVQRQLKKMKL